MCRDKLPAKKSDRWYGAAIMRVGAKMASELNEDLGRLTNLYDRLRSQVEHENELYNQRIVWLITMQAFLFATIGLLLQSRISATLEWSARLDGLIVVISIVGVLVAMISNRILGNARRALDEIGRRWSARINTVPPSVSDWFPNVQGVSGGSRFTLLRSGHLPKVFILAWFAVALLLLTPGAAFEWMFSSLQEYMR